MYARATQNGLARTLSSVSLWVDTSARALPGLAETSVTRVRVEDYSLNRGRFVLNPLLTVTMQLGSASVDVTPRTVRDLVSVPGADVWDPLDAGDSWPDLDEKRWMAASAGATLRVLPQSVVNRDCNLILPAVLLSPSSWWSHVRYAATDGWVAVALRVVAGGEDSGTGALLTVQLGELPVEVRWDRGVLQLISNHLVFDTLPVDSGMGGAFVLLLAVDGGQLMAAVEGAAGRVVQQYPAETGYPRLEQFFVGGSTSPEMLVYGVATGEGGVAQGLAMSNLMREMVTCL